MSVAYLECLGCVGVFQLKKRAAWWKDLFSTEEEGCLPEGPDQERAEERRVEWREDGDDERIEETKEDRKGLKKGHASAVYSSRLLLLL